MPPSAPPVAHFPPPAVYWLSDLVPRGYLKVNLAKVHLTVFPSSSFPLSSPALPPALALPVFFLLTRSLPSTLLARQTKGLCRGPSMAASSIREHTSHCPGELSADLYTSSCWLLSSHLEKPCNLL